MTAQAMPRRAAWEDRFRQPTPDELLRAINSNLGGEIAREARRRLLAFEGVSERVEWQGVPWRWSLVYSCVMDPTRAFAYIIPDPAKAQLSIPLTSPMVQALPLKRMRKVVRDGIVYSRFVAGVHWPCWQLDAVGQADDVMEIVQRKYRSVVGEWGGGPAGGASSPASKPGAKKSDSNGR